MNRFGIGTEWHFFKTSHGKSDCDNGNNGITKGLVVMARLENNADVHISTAKEMH